MKITNLYPLLLAASATFLTPSANAAWTLISASADGDVMRYANIATLKKTGSILRIWTVANYASPLQYKRGNPKPFYRSRMALDEFDCNSEQVRVLAFSLFEQHFGEGASVISDLDASRPSAWSVVTPGSVGSGVLATVCALGTPSVLFKSNAVIRDNDTVVVHAERPVTVQGTGLVRMRTMFDYKIEQKSSSAPFSLFRSQIFEDEYDCRASTLGSVSAISYSHRYAAGAIVEYLVQHSNQKSVSQQPFSQQQLSLACNSR